MWIVPPPNQQKTLLCYFFYNIKLHLFLEQLAAGVEKRAAQKERKLNFPLSLLELFYVLLKGK